MTTEQYRELCDLVFDGARAQQDRGELAAFNRTSALLVALARELPQEEFYKFNEARWPAPRKEIA